MLIMIVEIMDIMHQLHCVQVSQLKKEEGVYAVKVGGAMEIRVDKREEDDHGGDVHGGDAFDGGESGKTKKNSWSIMLLLIKGGCPLFLMYFEQSCL
ncbi:hypothetical protein L1987_21367 [Smallanthus sonchifolius]|uniref:Uncharacterized protein n=1 Tax=Smallanthus sonchifolius TaxID=185202 RepID=A0ACB9IUW7_9ASTR|nr:hypothetical protein L1987_21367 [Smallanthus sonchifolius]